MSIDGNSVVDELSFFLVQKSRFLGEVGDKDISEYTRDEGQDTHQDLLNQHLSHDQHGGGRTKIQDHPASPPAGAT
jgi:hypothetical protein